MSHLLDESTLANDVVRLLGGENQRLKRELQEAQQKAKAAEARATELEAMAFVKREPTDSDTQDLATTEQAHQLRDEITAVRAQYQDLEAKYDKEKEKRKLQKEKIKEIQAKDSQTNVEDSPEFLELQQLQEYTQAQLSDANERLDALRKDLEGANNKLASLSYNDPWAYIDSAFQRLRVDCPSRVEPFLSSNKEQLSSFKAFHENTLALDGLACIPFVYHRRDVLWSVASPGYGVTVGPSYRYVANGPQKSLIWVPDNQLREIEGPFELMFEGSQLFYYCGTYTTSIIQTRGNGRFFQSLDSRIQDQLMKATIVNRDLIPPIVEKTIKGMFLQGVLPVVCLVFERIGFNEELYKALLEFGGGLQGPQLALSRSHQERKRKANQGAEPGPSSKEKRARGKSVREVVAGPFKYIRV